MGFHEAQDVGPILLSLAWALLWVAPCKEFPGESILEACHAHENAMDIGRNRALRERLINCLGADLDAHLGTATEIDGPLEPFRRETGFLESLQRAVHTGRGDDQIDVGGGDGLLGPMVHGEAANDAPWAFMVFQCLDQQDDVPAAAGGLPIVKLSLSHGRWRPS